MLVLASQSPRRRELLANAGLPATVRVSGVPEERLPDESARQYVLRLARVKAEAVSRSAGEVVLGADTVVVLGREILEKPRDEEDAVRMLNALSGREHQVITGICLRHEGGSISAAEETTVRFTPLSAVEIAEYVASGEPMDKAGAYAIQGLASKFIHWIQGDYSNVVGLPVCLVYRCLKEIGVGAKLA
jgi:septum formation protein